MNIGRLDQIIRVVLGLVLIALAATDILGNWAYIGLIPLLTGMIRWCPLYMIAGVQTCPLHEVVYKNKK